MYGCFAHLYTCVLYAHSAYWGQIRVLDPRRLELQTVVSHHVDDRNQNLVLWESHGFSFLLSHSASSLSPGCFVFQQKMCCCNAYEKHCLTSGHLDQ